MRQREITQITKRLKDLEARCGHARLEAPATESIDDLETPEKLGRPRFRRSLFRASSKDPRFQSLGSKVLYGAREEELAEPPQL